MCFQRERERERESRKITVHTNSKSLLCDLKRSQAAMNTVIQLQTDKGVVECMLHVLSCKFIDDVFFGL